MSPGKLRVAEVASCESQWTEVSGEKVAHCIVKNTGAWLDCLGSGILVEKRYFKNIDLDNSLGG